VVSCPLRLLRIVGIVKILNGLGSIVTIDPNRLHYLNSIKIPVQLNVFMEFLGPLMSKMTNHFQVII